MHSIIKQTNDTILYQLAPGKPDPKEMATETGEMRGRVVQHYKRGSCCWYYAFNFLRKRIGPNHVEALKDARHIEKTISAIRQKSEAYQKTIPTICANLETDNIKTIFKALDQRTAKEQLSNWDNSPFKRIELELYLGWTVFTKEESQKHPQHKPGEYISFVPSLKAFSENPQGSENFFYYLHKKVADNSKVTQEVFKIFGTNVDQLYEQRFINALNFPPMSELPEVHKSLAMHSLSILTIAEKYNLKIAAWRPRDGIKALKISLEKHGPHFIAGKLGINQYIDKPFRLKDPIGNRSIWGWKPGASKLTSEILGHAVIVIGVQEATIGNRIYFIDPSDDSDPNDLEKQRIFTTGYSTFIERSTNLLGFSGMDERNPTPFAIHA